jgi:SAM-dependent methyltransferase
MDWEARWQNQDTGWDRGGASPALTHWLERRQVHGDVLIPGAGSGHEVLELARLGYAVTALEIAPTAVLQLRTRLHRNGLNAKVRQVDMLQWSAPQPFDTIYEQTSLCALPPERWPSYAEQLHGWLKPGGHLLAQFMQTGEPGGPPYDCPLAAMQALFSDALWVWPEAPAIRVDHPSGRHELCLALLRR